MLHLVLITQMNLGGRQKLISPLIPSHHIPRTVLSSSAVLHNFVMPDYMFSEGESGEHALEMDPYLAGFLDGMAAAQANSTAIIPDTDPNIPAFDEPTTTQANTNNDALCWPLAANTNFSATTSRVGSSAPRAPRTESNYTPDHQLHDTPVVPTETLSPVTISFSLNDHLLGSHQPFSNGYPSGSYTPQSSDSATSSLENRPASASLHELANTKHS